jgi:hypothetical protein
MYDYIAKSYGIRPIVGERVRLEGPGARWGNVAPESPSHGHYVQVIFDGSDFASNCHPRSLEYSNQQAPHD